MMKKTIFLKSKSQKERFTASLLVKGDLFIVITTQHEAVKRRKAERKK